MLSRGISYKTACAPETKTQISLRTHASSKSKLWIAKDPRSHQTYNEDCSDLTNSQTDLSLRFACMQSCMAYCAQGHLVCSRVDRKTVASRMVVFPNT